MAQSESPHKYTIGVEKIDTGSSKYPTDLALRFHSGTSKNQLLVPHERILQSIFLLREQKIMLASDLARLFGVETFNLNKAVKRNIERFPSDFMFQLTKEEAAFLRFHFGISKTSGRGGSRYLPYAFTEHGVVMLASVLKSPTAIRVSVQVVRTFIRLRKFLASNANLARKLKELEKKYDSKFKVVIKVIEQLAAPRNIKKRRIGFFR